MEPALAFIPSPELQILVIDDGPEIHHVMTVYLQGNSVHIDQVQTAQEAVAACLHKSYDYILLDMQFPQDNGLRIMRQLRELQLSQFPKVLAFTAAASASEAEVYQSNGFVGLLPKPFTQNTLRMALHLI